MHFARSNRSALSGSFAKNQTQDRQFPFCHCMPFKRFCNSDSDSDMMFRLGMSSGKYLTSEEEEIQFQIGKQFPQEHLALLRRRQKANVILGCVRAFQTR